MRKIMKVIASVYLTETPVTHILEVFTRLQGDYDIELILLNTPDKSKVTKLSKKIVIRETPLTQYQVPFLRGLLYEMYVILHLLTSKENIDIIYSRLRPYSFAEYVVYKLKKVPVITEVNGILAEEILLETKAPSFLNPLILKIASFIERRTLSISRKIISVTSNIKNILHENYHIPHDKIVVIENGANTQMFKPIDKKKAKRKLNLEEIKEYITFVGNLAPWQGVEFFIQAAPLVLKEFPEINFLVVGDGSMKEELLKMVDDLNLHDYFLFTGMVPYEDVPSYINASDVCVAPFIRERNEDIGLSPLKIYEYLACGKAVISSRIPNLEFIEEKMTGILVNPENPKKLAKAIIKLLKDDALKEQMGKNGRKYLIENNSWDVVTERIEKILEDIPDI